ncbi:MAG: hypothetical protein ACQSGP_27400, partial [Frankia sp.]
APPAFPRPPAPAVAPPRRGTFEAAIDTEPTGPLTFIGAFRDGSPTATPRPATDRGAFGYDSGGVETRQRGAGERHGSPRPGLDEAAQRGAARRHPTSRAATGSRAEQPRAAGSRTTAGGSSTRKRLVAGTMSVAGISALFAGVAAANLGSGNAAAPDASTQLPFGSAGGTPAFTGATTPASGLSVPAVPAAPAAPAAPKNGTAASSSGLTTTSGAGEPATAVTQGHVVTEPTTAATVITVPTMPLVPTSTPTATASPSHTHTPKPTVSPTGSPTPDPTDSSIIGPIFGSASPSSSDTQLPPGFG